MGVAKLTIIIPHYNSAILLEKLLSTIPQNDEIQVIVVDDYSNQYLDEYCECKKKYENVEFYANESVKGAGAARNTGLKYAKGEWLMFADADDYYLPGFYEKVSAYFETDYDIVYFVPTSIDSRTGEETKRHRPYERYVCHYLDEPSIRHFLALKYSYESPWSKLIRHSLFKDNNISFDEVMYSNDVMASVKSAYYAKKIGASRDKIYCITQGENTLTSTLTREKYNIRLKVYFRKHRFLKKNLSRKEYQLFDCKVEIRMRMIERNNLGRWFYYWTFFRIVIHGIPVWREYGPYSRVWRKKN